MLKYKAAAYMRLSVTDDKKIDGESIENQEKIIDLAKREGAY